MKTHNDHIGRQIAVKGYYELPMLQFIKNNIPKGNYIDAGANIGNHSVYFAKECGCKCYSFEPDIENFKLLIENTKGLDVLSYNIGLSDKFDVMGIHRNTDNMGMNKLIEGNEISVNKLDSLGIGSVKLIKIDVEGMEYEVVKGAEETIRQFNPALFIETDKPQEILKLLPKNYKIKQQFNATPTYYYDIR